jgi:hypothetical protein
VLQLDLQSEDLLTRARQVGLARLRVHPLPLAARRISSAVTM